MRRVVNQPSVGSFGVDSLANGAPPPGYTSQRDAASSIAVINDDELQEDGMLKNSSPPPSMESPHRDPLPTVTLPSPYSIEDLRVRSQRSQPSHEQDQNPRLSLHQSSTHGYAPTHSQCTPVRSSSYYPPQQQQQRDAACPLSSDALHFYSPPHILSTDNLFGATNEQPRPYYRSSTEEHWQPPAKADNQHQHQQPTSPYTDYSLPTSPYHHHRQNTYPPPLRVLTYSSTDEGHYGHGCMEYGNEEEGNQSFPANDQRMMMLMNSTATILSPSEEPLGYQSSHDLPRRRRRRPSLPSGPTRQATIAIDPSKTVTKKGLTAKSSAKAHSTQPPLPPTQTQPTNYVYISRKCNPSIPISKSRGRQKTVVQPNFQIPPAPPKLSSTSSSSAITGTFTINPELHIPPSLLNAMEDPVFFRFNTSSDTGETRKKKGSKRKTNLRLEVENGGIEVDIRLVPTTSISNNVGEEATCTGDRGQQARDTSFCDTPVQAPASASASTTAFSGPPSSSTHPRQSSSIRMQENPSGVTSSSRKGIITPEVTQHTSSRPDKKKSSRPTTIDLRIKQAYSQQGSLDLQNQDSVKINGPIAFPLIARIHAPNPRPPFHLFASTIDIPTTNPIQATDSTTSNQHTSRSKEPLVLNTRNQSGRASTSNRPTFIRNSQVFSEPTPIIVNPPPSLLPRRRTRRSLSKYRPQRISVASSHGHGTTTGGASQAPPSSLSQLNLASSSLYSSPPLPPPSSPLYLHLPRTFRGPLTIHISSGHISDRLRLSDGLEREVALIRESEFSRGYFVGGLGRDNNMDADRKKRVQVQDDRREEEMGGNDVNLGASGNSGRGQIERTKKKTHLGNKNPNKNIVNSVDEFELSSSSVSSSSSSPGSSPGFSSSPAAWKGVQGEWYGDRIEILVGSGDVFLQFEDENADDDPFCRTRGMKKEVGFWKRFFSYPIFFS